MVAKKYYYTQTAYGRQNILRYLNIYHGDRFENTVEVCENSVVIGGSSSRVEKLVVGNILGIHLYCNTCGGG